MKLIYLTLFCSIFCCNFVNAQTYAKLPSPENVLVVYKAKENPQDTLGMISDSVMLHYKNARNIPTVNIISPGLRFPDTTFSVDGVAHTDGLGQVTDNIRDFDNHNSGTWYATEHAWKYFYKFVAQPIKNYLINHNLVNTVRYIVLIKGVPCKVQAGADSGAVLCNVSADGLLCMLNTDDYEDFLHSIYTEFKNEAIPPPPPPENYHYTPLISNPYYNSDPYLSMDYRFLPDNFTETWNGYNVKLSYLVSHLDGKNKQNVYDIIDRSVNADNSGEGWWILDGHQPDPDPDTHTYCFEPSLLQELGANVYYDCSTTWIVDNDAHNDQPVMGYVSNGTHAGMDTVYWIDTLDFQYLNGAIATTYESFNGNSLTTLKWRGQSLITQFTEHNLHHFGGSGFSANAWEPIAVDVTKPEIYFLNYAAGYNQIDAAYMGTPKLAWVNVIMGDPLTAIGNLIEIDTLTGTLQADLNNVKIVVPIKGSLTIPDGTNLNINNFGGITVWGKLTIGNGSEIKVYNHGVIKVEEGGELIFETNSRIQTYDESIVDSRGKITCNQGVQITNGNVFNVAKKFFSNGTEDSPVNIYSLNIFNDFDSLVVCWTNFDNSNIAINNNFRKGLLDIEFSVFENSSISVSNMDKINIINDNFNLVQSAIDIIGSHISTVENCFFNNCTYEIKSGTNYPTINLLDSLVVTKCSFIKFYSPLGPFNGIFITNVDEEFTYLKIDSLIFEGYDVPINLNRFSYCSPIISNCIITDYTDYGLSLTNGSSAVISNNQISTSNITADNPIGIYLSQVTSPYLLDNSISTDLPDPGSGIVSVSSNGNYLLNTITGYYNGVELGNSSSPYMALNEIYHNKKYGIYLSTGSNPKLNKAVSGGTVYPVSGYNNIYENGTPTQLLSDPDLFLNSANIQLSKGCNTISDDRNDLYDHQILMDGVNVRNVINADSNYWGDHSVYGHDPGQRFGTGISVRYIPFNTAACIYSPNNTDMLLLTTNTGSVVDTIFSDGTIAYQLSPIETAYSDANQYFYSSNFSEAESKYMQIINGSEDSTYSLEAYNRLYVIKKYQNANSQSYENLRQYYQEKLSSIEDTSILLAVNNLIDMCRVSKNEYDQAINSFDETAENNPGTDIALYNIINAYTTALLVDSTNGLGKAAKYKTGDISEYLENVSELLKSRGKNVESEKNKLIPTKFYLYQNYPNPFNPVTTIKYAIPKTVNVELKVFDILGREVKTLVNDTMNPGYYEVQFNAGNFASGVYFYRIKAGEFIKTGKMLLLK